MRIKDEGISVRTAEELLKLGDTPHDIAKIIKCPSNQVKHWLDCEYDPSAYYLKRFYEVGLDIIYILTGNRGVL